MFHLTRVLRLPAAQGSKFVKDSARIAATFVNTPCPLRRCFHDEFTTPEPVSKDKAGAAKQSVPTAVAAKYQAFRDVDATVILDVDEERQRHMLELVEAEETSVDQDAAADIYAGLNMERGLNGVFEIDDLVEVLRRDHADEIFVCRVPPELKYVDFICVVTGRSQRHRVAMAQFVRKMFKLKRRPGEPIPRIEGEQSKDWMAVDLGNIALHIFSAEARKRYDLESLWTVGAEFDAECQKPNDELVEMYEKHSIYLGDLTPNRSA